MSTKKHQWLATVAAIVIGALIGWLLADAFFTDSKPRKRNAPAVQYAAAAKPPLISQTTCTMGWEHGKVLVFSNADNVTCSASPADSFTATRSFLMPPGPVFGVVCGLRKNSTWQVIASAVESDYAGLFCDNLIGNGWTEDPALGSDYNQAIQTWVKNGT